MVARIEAIVINLLIWLVIATVLVAAQRRSECCEEYCYDLDNQRPQSAHFGSKTAYLNAKGPESGTEHLVSSKFFRMT